MQPQAYAYAVVVGRAAIARGARARAGRYQIPRGIGRSIPRAPPRRIDRSGHQQL
jgi:hypothetical protein